MNLQKILQKPYLTTKYLCIKTVKLHQQITNHLVLYSKSTYLGSNGLHCTVVAT